jgi:hypothetical protein
MSSAGGAEYLAIDKRDIAIQKIHNSIKRMDNEIADAYKRMQKKENNESLHIINNKLLDEYEKIIDEEEHIKKKQIKFLKKIYNYINEQEKMKKKKNPTIIEDKTEIKKEIKYIEKKLRK